MLLKIIINILLCGSIFFDMIAQDYSYNTLKYAISISSICISISLYILCEVETMKNYRNRLLLINGIYLCIISFIFRPVTVLILPLITDYVKSKRINEIYIVVFFVISLIMQLKFGVSYSIVSLGIIATLYTYESVSNIQRKEELEKINYDLREKLYYIENKRTLEKKFNLQNIESIKVNERNLISQKIHDNIGHTLAGSIMQLEAIKIVVAKDLEKGISMIDGITSNLRKGMDEIRYTLRTIKPEQSEIGVNKLKLILDEFTKEYKISTELDLEGDLKEINILYWKAIIDTVKESLTNTIKHANGDYIYINISVLNKIIRVHIKDNGNYYGHIKKGMGLLGIEERIINTGGDVIFDNENGFSTLIILKR